MKKVWLRFETILQLADFLEVMAMTKYTIDRISNIIVCELGEADIELAKRSYHAKLLRAQFS
jgi:hypothetical protein